jgi:copper chaperone
VVEFNIQAMTCGHCASLVTKAIKAVDPKAKVDIDLAKQKVRVDTEEDRDAIAGALEDAGYPPT